MELKLKGHGTIKITSATLVEGGDILIEAEDGFAEIAKTTNYEITEVYITENEYGIYLVAYKDTSDDWYEEDSIVYEIEDANCLIGQMLSYNFCTST